MRIWPASVSGSKAPENCRLQLIAEAICRSLLTNLNSSHQGRIADHSIIGFNEGANQILVTMRLPLAAWQDQFLVRMVRSLLRVQAMKE